MVTFHGTILHHHSAAFCLDWHFLFSFSRFSISLLRNRDMAHVPRDLGVLLVRHAIFFPRGLPVSNSTGTGTGFRFYSSFSGFLSRLKPKAASAVV